MQNSAKSDRETLPTLFGLALQVQARSEEAWN